MTSHPITDPPIVAFVRERLEEDVAIAARAAKSANGNYRQWDVIDVERRSETTGLPRKQKAVVSGPRPDLVADCPLDITPDISTHIARHDPKRVLREVAAKRALLERESTVTLPEWEPDCGGDWVLSGPGFLANYWPDNTVSASITDGFDGPALADSGIVPKESRASCQAFAEEWIRKHLPERSPVLRALSAVYSDHPDYNSEWAVS